MLLQTASLRAPPLTLQAFVPGSASTLVFADGSTTIMLEDDEPEE